MGKTVLFVRLAARDLRRHLAEAVLLFLVIAVAATTLTLGLILHGETSDPYNTTRSQTAGPDVVANLTPRLSITGSVTGAADPATLTRLGHAEGVTVHTRPYPATFALVQARGLTSSALLEGRDQVLGPVDRPELTAGGWIRPGAVVIERSFATALGVHPGDRISLNGRPYRVAGIAVDAAIPPYPFVCEIGCAAIHGPSPVQIRLSEYKPGTIWLARSDIGPLTNDEVGVSYLLDLRLADAAQAPEFAQAHTTTPSRGSIVLATSWQKISFDAAKLIRGPRLVLQAGSALLVVLALASVAVLVGRRLSEQTYRVGLLKAVGATPRTVAAVLVVEHVAVTLVAAGAGLAVGRAAVPLLAGPGNGLVGTSGAPPMTGGTVAVVTAVALAVSLLATVAPAIQAARISTIEALSDAARTPRRHALIVATSNRLPIPILLGVRVAARRPRRLALGTLSVGVTVGGVVAILVERLRLQSASNVINPQYQRITRVMAVITILLIVLAAINALLIIRSTIIDNRRGSALAQALGASPRQVAAGLSVTQLFTALPGSILGVPLGIALLQIVAKSSDAYRLIPSWWYPTIILSACIAITALTAIPARIGAHRPVAEQLRADT